MKVTGSCFCGELAYEAEVDPAAVGICHCRDCQKFSGSAFRMAAAVQPDALTFTRGTPTFFEKTGDAGGVRRMAFCGTCGTHICALPVGGSAHGMISLRLTTAENIDDLAPQAEYYLSSRLPWMKDLDNTHQFQTIPTAEDVANLQAARKQ